MAKQPNRFPGTHEATGWPLLPAIECRIGLLICHLAVEPIQACKRPQPDSCPFYGRWPRAEELEPPAAEAARLAGQLSREI